MKKYPNVKITVSESGSGNGVKSLINSTCDIATMSRFMKDNEFKSAVSKNVLPVAHIVALDGICIIVHPSNNVSNLTIEQIQEIYTGKINNWKQVGGQNSPIVVISRDTNSGTYETFENIVMSGKKMSQLVEYTSSNGAARSRIKDTKAGIAYIGVGFTDKTTKSIKVNGVSANLSNIRSGKYKITRPLYMFTNRYPEIGSYIYEFITFHLSEQGQEIISEIGFVPIVDYNQ
jgi:phosphate transport system substrate-binding protein